MNGIKYRSADEMKDSGIDWIGNIPKDWQAKKLKYIAQCFPSNIDKKSHENEPSVKLCNYTDAYKNDFITANMPFMDATASMSQIVRYGLRQGDIVITKDSESPDDIGIPAYVLESIDRLVCGYHLSIIRTFHIQHSLFFYYHLRSTGIRKYFETRANGITRYALGSDDFNQLFLSVPSYFEQRKIANFLDIKTAQFDSIIAKKEQLIAKLEDAKKSLISEVVTGKVKIVDGQLVPRQPEEMKDSGVEWLGMIPKEWSVRKFSHIIAIANGQVDPRISPFKEMILIAPNHIESNTGRILNLQSAEDQSADSGKYFCDKGDVIYSKIRPALCKACIAPMDCLTSADMYPMKADKKLLMNEWFLMILLSNNFTSAVILDSDRVAMPKVNRDSLSSYKLPVPSLLEQKSILSLIMTKQFEMDSVLEKTNLQISLLKSAKQSLISEAVTGKIDLRDWEINEQGGAS